MITEKDILNALKSIIDPDFQKDIVSLGFVKNIKIDGNDVSCDIELTTPACPVKSEFQQKAQDAIKSLGAKKILVQMTSSPKTTTQSTQNFKTTLSSVNAIIAVSSCKGGVGKSTVAACLAKELSQRGFKVGLLDADIYGPSIPTLFNLKKQDVLTNEKDEIIPIEVDGLKIMSFGFLLGDSPAVLRGPIVSSYIQQLLHKTNWGKLDYLFIDFPPGTGDIQLTITQSARLTGAVIVTTKQTLSLVDVARGILMFEKVSVPMLGIIENMSYFECAKCQTKHYIFGGSEEEEINTRFGLEILAKLPIMPDLTGQFDRTIKNSAISHAVDRVVMSLGRSFLSHKVIPKAEFDKEKTVLVWPDGKSLSVGNFELRLNCQCALCVNEFSGKKTLTADHIKKDIMPQSIIPLGNYAINVIWNDGHSSSIYPYADIEKLASAKA
ncbi:MAG: P-loop NTPase [Candidatus Omnitrophota bacterium]